MKNFTKSKVLVFIFSLFVTFGSWAQLSCYQSVGYFPSWTGATTSIDYSKWTHINYSFAIPNGDGSVGPIENSAKLVDLVNRGHANNTKVLLAIGGWLSSSPGGTPFESIATNPTAINNFVNTCANLINQYNLDGIDIDWEYPTSQARWNAVIGPLASRIHGMGKLLTAAVAGGAYFGNGFGDVSQLDLVNIMAYDCNCPTNSPYSAAVDGINYWAGRGVPQNKRILGLPFYSSDNNTSLHVQKTNYAKSNAGGIMVWEISSPGDINSIVSTLGNLCKGGTPPPPGVASVYEHCSFGGTSAGLPVGNYTLSQLNSRGIANDFISSLKVNSGYEVVLYQHDNFTGTSLIFSGDDGCLVDNGANDWASSLRVRTKTGSFSQTVQAENYSAMSGVQTEGTSDAGGGSNVGWIDTGDWMAYNSINVPSSGSYLVEYRVASPNSNAVLSLDLNAGSIQLGTRAIPNTGGWQNWTTVSHTVNINAGTYNFGIFAQTGGFNINWWRISKSSGARLGEPEIIASSTETRELQLYPNPVSSNIFISSNLFKGAKINILSADGINRLKGVASENGIDVSKLSPGLYTMVIDMNGQRVMRKFIKN
ncbi:MAG TPA: glycosyl hydrolase family 18 protein [Cytophagales bacterium]|nr:glycosyl hydrolase family 18 protein [Cytophagales bacterium]